MAPKICENIEKVDLGSASEKISRFRSKKRPKREENPLKNEAKIDTRVH